MRPSEKAKEPTQESDLTTKEGGKRSRKSEKGAGKGKQL